LETLDNVQPCEEVLVNSQLSYPVNLQVPAGVFVALWMLLKELVAAVELQASED
jgi:hypothetical protein